VGELLLGIRPPVAALGAAAWASRKAPPPAGGIEGAEASAKMRLRDRGYSFLRVAFPAELGAMRRGKAVVASRRAKLRAVDGEKGVLRCRLLPGNPPLGQMFDQSGAFDNAAFDQKFARGRLWHHGANQDFKKLSLR
jgi:hypothetical protein